MQSRAVGLELEARLVTPSLLA